MTENYRDRRLTERLRDPEFRHFYEEAQKAIAAGDLGALTKVLSSSVEEQADALMATLPKERG